MQFWNKHYKLCVYLHEWGVLHSTCTHYLCNSMASNTPKYVPITITPWAADQRLPQTVSSPNQTCEANATANLQLKSTHWTYFIDIVEVLRWFAVLASILFILSVHKQNEWIGRQICLGRKFTRNALVELASFQRAPHLTGYHYIAIDLLEKHFKVVGTTTLGSFYPSSFEVQHISGSFVKTTTSKLFNVSSINLNNCSGNNLTVNKHCNR